jgi:iron complex outermembrane receptor protein
MEQKNVIFAACLSRNRFHGARRMSHLPNTRNRRGPALTTGALAFLAAAVVAPLLAQTAPTPSPAKPDEPIQLEKFVTIGSRFNDRSVIDSPVPIDVLSGLDLQLNGYTEMGQTLSVTVPSIDFPRPSNTDGTDSVRPAALRGLSPDQTLVLLNGKRFHASALVNLNGSVGRGSAAVDLNAVPSFALNGAEVLRDGAAAQYGSDAIAGVINLPLRGDLGYSLTSTGGQTFNHDGATISASANYGEKLGDNGGFINVTAYFKNRGSTARSGPDLRQQYFGTNPATGALVAPGTTIGVINGTPDPRETTFNRSQVIFGDPVNHERGFFLNSEAPLSNGVTFYAFGGMSRRESFSFASWRRAADSTDVRAIYPDGFQPQINPHIIDVDLTAGIKGTVGGWKWDLSDTWGKNTIDYYTIHSLNVTYGAASQTRFYDGLLGFQQHTANFDLTGQIDAGLPSPLKTAAGLEYRWDNYWIRQGEHASYDNGGVLVLDGPSKGTVPAYGAQGFPGFRPTDETDMTRSNVAGYVDVENQLTKKWMIDVAGRAEHYSDSGDTVTGKIATRYEITPWLAARASFSNGFRAPALQQATFTTTSSVILTVNGLTGPYQVKTFQVADPAAVALGATPLKPENSTNFSGGFTFTPFKGFSTSIDYYNIAINDKIVLSSNFATTSVAAFLAAQGYPGLEGGRYFTNAVNSRTQGLDVTSRYTFRLADGDRLSLTAGFNYNDTVVTYIKATPANVLTLTGGTPIFDRQSTLRYERGTPLDKVVASATYDLGSRFSFLVRENWYGSVLSAGTAAATDQQLSAKFLTDAEVSWHIKKDFTIALGANNVFNVYPDKMNAANNTSGLGQYSSFSPFGFNGGFYYGRLNYKF